nr:MAG TPA: hypothetical protein [Caudoviricetes sp.]
MTSSDGSGIDRYAQQRLWNAMCGDGSARRRLDWHSDGTVEICCDSQRRGCERDCEAKAKNRLAPRGHGMLCLRRKG